MIQVEIESVRMSLLSQHRLVVLKDIERERFLAIWIGPFEADAITIELQGVQVARPLTHDLLRTIISTVGLHVNYVVVNDLRNETFYARIVMDFNGKTLEVDSRPSDAIALAVRVAAPKASCRSWPSASASWCCCCWRSCGAICSKTGARACQQTYRISSSSTFRLVIATRSSRTCMRPAPRCHARCR